MNVISVSATSTSSSSSPSLYTIYTIYIYLPIIHTLFRISAFVAYNEQSPRRSLNRIPIEIISKHREILFFLHKIYIFPQIRTHARMHTATNESVVGTRIRLFSYEIKLLLALCIGTTGTHNRCCPVRIFECNSIVIIHVTQTTEYT